RNRPVGRHQRDAQMFCLVGVEINVDSEFNLLDLERPRQSEGNHTPPCVEGHVLGIRKRRRINTKEMIEVLGKSVLSPDSAWNQARQSDLGRGNQSRYRIE